MYDRSAVLAIWLGLARLVAGAVPHGLAAIELTSPDDLDGTYPGYFAPASKLPPPTWSQISFTPANDSSGCGEYQKAGPDTNMVVVSVDGCELAEKVARAQEAGVDGMLLVMDSDLLNLTLLDTANASGDNFEIFVVGVSQSLGERIWLAQLPGRPVVASISEYRGVFPLYDPSVWVLVLLAVSLIYAGAKFGVADLMDESPVSDVVENAGAQTIPWWLPFFWVVGASFMLVFLYFTMRWLIYVVLAVFGIGGAMCMAEIGRALLGYKWESLRMPICDAPLFRHLERAQAIAFLFAIANSTAWFFLRKTEYAWPFQNMIGICFLCFFQCALRLPSIKIAASLLTMMFFFDIFWVFLSPLFFAKSVMVAVAMGGGSGEVAPMLLRIPPFGYPLEGDRMLGYGDIAIPGLLVSFLHRYDIRCYRGWAAGYFLPAVVGYGVGLCCALAALYIMQMGQPALLYLVPGTLGTTMVIACKRGEVKALWEGKPVDSGDGSLLPGTRFCPQGHRLQPLREQGENGQCDHCGQAVRRGDVVMACIHCSPNWCLCEACRPRLPHEEPREAAQVLTNAVPPAV